jgi:hypothetical protein
VTLECKQLDEVELVLLVKAIATVNATVKKVIEI